MNLSLDPNVVAERPTEPGAYIWHGLFTPFRANGSPNGAAMVESRARQLLPVAWTLGGSYDEAQHLARLSGVLTQGGQPVSTRSNSRAEAALDIRSLLATRRGLRGACRFESAGGVLSSPKLLGGDG